MKSRWVALAIALLIPACGGGSGGSAALPLTILATGGGSSNGAGGQGAKITLRSAGPITSAEGAPAAPALPTVPATGTELINTAITAGTPIAGNILVSSTLQIAASVNPAVITTNTGDVVIRGTLIAERAAGTTTAAIAINAPAGTIHVYGSILARGTAGTPDNPNGGAVTLTAQRIVVHGTIDTRGEDLPAGTGGDGGAITLDTTGGGGTDILFTSGLVIASGGRGGLQGGNGGMVTLRAGAQLAVYGSITTDGGSANSLVGTNPRGGDGGNVLLQAGATGANLALAVSTAGGAASGFVDGAIGGDGGTLAVSTAGPVSLFGSITTSSGFSHANVAGAGVIGGGMAGTMDVGLAPAVQSLELGRGTLATRGGDGDQGNAAGDLEIVSLDGDVSLRGLFDARGGSGTLGGGNGGDILISTDQDPAGNTANHALSIDGDVWSGGGNAGATSGGVGGDGGSLTVRGGGGLSVNGLLRNTGGTGFNAFSMAGDGAAVIVEVTAANTTPSGRIDLIGGIRAEGATNSGGVGGHAGSIFVSAVSGVSASGTFSAAGGDSGGTGASITIQSTAGDVELAGVIDTSGGTSNTVGNPGADLTVSTSGHIVSSAAIDVSGGPANAPNSNIPGGDGGNLTFLASGATSTITLLPGSSIHADGGSSTPGSFHHAGGAGGVLRFTTVDGVVSLTGMFTAVGGTSQDGPGGLGGQVIVNSDSDGNNTGGAITLTEGSVIDVSGGVGVTGAAARNNGGVAPADSTGANLAVVLDAAGALTTSPNGGNGGQVRNLGSIIATGHSLVARGGDVWFDGKNGLGANLGLADGGVQTLTGPFGNGVFFPK